MDKVKKDREANQLRNKINKMTPSQKKKYIEKGEYWIKLTEQISHTVLSSISAYQFILC